MTLYRLPNSDNEHAYTPVTNGRCKECFQHPQRCAVPVEPSGKYCTKHRAMALEFSPQWCAETGYLDRTGKKNPCVMVDAWLGEPA